MFVRLAGGRYDGLCLSASALGEPGDPPRLIWLWGRREGPRWLATRRAHVPARAANYRLVESGRIRRPRELVYRAVLE